MSIQNTIPEELDGGAIDETATNDVVLDDIDKALLSTIQSGFPIAQRPYAILGEQLGISEEEALDRVRALRKNKIIRRIGANYNSAKIGFRSTLCAAKVPDDKMELFTQEVNRRPGVTHNYLRDHIYNIWFTLISPSKEDMLRDLAEIEANTGVSVLNLPAEKLYKIKVDFQLQDNKQ